VILLDLLMPRMDGFAFLDALGADTAHRDIPVIVLTAKCVTDEDRRRLHERVLGLIEKHHLDRQGLIQEIRRALLLTDQMDADGSS
jgi:CheY-like chemotaxis protein